jgi:hypothetical protein
MNQNLRPAHLLHFKLGHAGFQWCQQLCRVPTDPLREQVLKPKYPSITTCDAPLCTACQLSKQNRRQPQTPITHANPVPTLCFENLQPGDCVSMDQCLSPQPSRLPHTKGKELKTRQYNCGMIFVDHASSFIFFQQ